MGMHRRFYPLVLNFCICIPMSALMSIVGVIRNFGITDDLPERWFWTFLTMSPFALTLGFLIHPLSVFLADRLPWKK